MEYKDTKKVIKPRHGRDFWRSMLEEQVNSGQSVAEFCRDKHLEQVTFYSWRKRLGHQKDMAQRVVFTPIKVKDESFLGMELLLPGGLVLRFSGPAPVDYLLQLSNAYAVV